MGPADIYSPATAARTQRPECITEKTPITRYRIELRKWVKNVNIFAQPYRMEKFIRNGAGNLIYLACEEVAQDKIQNARQMKILNL